MTRPDRRLDQLAERLALAARIKPAIDAHIAQMLSQCDTQQVNETGISSNTLSDPVVTAVLARAHWVDRSNLINDCQQRLEAAANDLANAMNDINVPRVVVEHPTCTGGDPSTWGDHQCSRHVRSYRRADSSTGYASNMLCDMHDRARLRWEANTREGAA